jgi:outer membrane protein assembly factor BamB
VYVGGLDGNLYARDAASGNSRWTFRPTMELASGWSVNPLVVNGMVYAGNRNGYFYAVRADTGVQVWSYKTNGPIQFSAAYKNGIVYFASNDSYAYALNAATGALM